MTGMLGALVMAAGVPAAFACSARGAESIAPVTAAQACDTIRAAVERAIGDARGIRVTLSFTAVIAKAEVVDARGGTPRTLPTQYHSTMDRALDAGALTPLARAVAAVLSD